MSVLRSRFVAYSFPLRHGRIVSGISEICWGELNHLSSDSYQSEISAAQTIKYPYVILQLIKIFHSRPFAAFHFLLFRVSAISCSRYITFLCRAFVNISLYRDSRRLKTATWCTSGRKKARHRKRIKHFKCPLGCRSFRAKKVHNTLGY